jgi:hypothetical protein
MPDSRTKIRAVVVEFETQANMKASGGGRRYRKSAGCLTRARKKREKEKEASRSGRHLWTRRGSAPQIWAAAGPAVMRRESSSGWKQAARRRDGRASFRWRPCPLVGGGGGGSGLRRRKINGRELGFRFGGLLYT